LDVVDYEWLWVQPDLSGALFIFFLSVANEKNEKAGAEGG
jgi:hypothetical protein